MVGTRTTAADGDEACDEWIVADFSDPAQVATCADRVGELAPDILVNNAGINVIGPFVDVDPADFARVQLVNLHAPFVLCQAVIPKMRERGWGRIVNVSSIWGMTSKAGRAAYSASKFGLDGLTVALAAEHTSDGILANCVAPGFIDTELTRETLGEDGIRTMVAGVPAGRLGSPGEIAEVVLWLASEENGFIAGQNVVVDGGFTRVG